jgi:hypothetical protein
MERIKALDGIAEYRGWKTLRDMSDLRNLSPSEIHASVIDVMIPALALYNIHIVYEGKK